MLGRVLQVLLAGVTVGLAGCAATDGPGTRSDPTPVGEQVAIGAYAVAVGSTDTDASAVVVENDPANTPPAEGRQFVMVPVSVTRQGGGIGVPWFDLAIRFAAADGSWYGGRSEDQCGELPDALMYLGELGQGESRLGNACVSVPSEAIEGGLWFVRPEFTYTGWSGYFQMTPDQPDVPGSPWWPTPVDEAVPVGAYSVSMGPTVRDAGDLVAEYRETNPPPEDGYQYVLAPMTVTHEGGATTSVPWYDLDVWFVAEDGTVYDTGEEGAGCGEISDAFVFQGEVPEGETVTVNACLAVPWDQVESGLWLVKETGTAMGWSGFFELG